MQKLFALFALFRKGNAVADPALWKNGGAALQAALVPFFLALPAALRSFGVDVDLSPEVATAIAGGVVALVGVLVTFISSDKVGLPAVARAPGDAPASQPGPLASPAGGQPADAGAVAAMRAQPGSPNDPSNYLPG